LFRYNYNLLGDKRMRRLMP